MNVQTVYAAVSSFQYFPEILTTILVLILRFMLRAYLHRRFLSLSEAEYEGKVYQQQQFFRWVNILTVMSLLLVWFAQVQNVLLSVVAIAAALVVATKELILCFMGGVYIRFSHAFTVKDRIEINNTRGYVMKHGLLYTRVLEIGPEKESQQTTGTIITIPNAVFLTHTLKNESYFGGYTIKSFHFHVPVHIEVQEAEEFLQLEANQMIESYKDIAQKVIVDACKEEGLSLPAVHTRIKLLYSIDGKISLLLKMPVESTQIADTEQRLMRSYIRFLQTKVNPEVNA